MGFRNEFGMTGAAGIFLHGEVFSKVDFAGDFAFQDFLFASLNHDLSCAYDDGTVGDFKCVANIVVGD